METISEINNHKFQTINENKFTQGNLYIKNEHKFDNSFITIPKFKFRERQNNLFDQIIYIIEGHNYIEKIEYKNKLINTLTPELLKTICKKHKQLKNDIILFFEEEKYILPVNKDVINFFSMLLKGKIIIIYDNYYITYNHDDNYDKIYLISENIVKKFEFEEEALMYLCDKKLKEYKDIKNMKIQELKDYAEYLGLKGSKKQELIELINKHFKKE